MINILPSCAVTVARPDSESTAAKVEEEEDPFVSFGKSLSQFDSFTDQSTTSTTTKTTNGLGTLPFDNNRKQMESGDGKSLEEAMRDSQKKRRIDPRTHG